jgi:hypothetical protein
LNCVGKSDIRATVINWKNNLSSIIDGYNSVAPNIAHAIQKDAIQNGWDAKVRGNGGGWSFEFELLNHDGTNYLAMTDNGTTGLTGRILKPKDLEQDLPIEEKWGRFENVAFTKDPSENALGSRGRGKFIFVGASKKKTICYDTLRHDGLYRFGVRWLELTDSPIAAYENKEAKKKLREILGGLLLLLITLEPG